MAKTLQENKAVTPQNERPRDTRIEGRDAGPGEKEVNFPTLGVTVVVPVDATDDQARAEADKVLANRSKTIENKSLNGDNENA